MKQVITIFLLIAVGYGFSSCRKSYGCSCHYYVRNNKDTGAIVNVDDMSRNDAGTVCHNAEQSYDQLWGASDSTGCTLEMYK